MFRTKIIRPELKVLDPERGTVEAVVSTEDVDRDGDIMRQRGWDLTNFLKNPLLIASHDHQNLRSIIGEWETMEVKGKRLVGTARYYIGEGNEEADWGFNLALKGRAAYSVGFLPDMDKAKALGKGPRFGLAFEFLGQELLEVSHVSIPSNPAALQRMKGLSLHPAIAEVIGELTEGMPSDAERILAFLEKMSGQMEELLKANRARDLPVSPKGGNHLSEYQRRYLAAAGNGKEV